MASFHRALEIRVRQYLEKQPAIWHDPKLQGDDVFAGVSRNPSHRIPLRVRQAAVAIFSPKLGTVQFGTLQDEKTILPNFQSPIQPDYYFSLTHSKHCLCHFPHGTSRFAQPEPALLSNQFQRFAYYAASFRSVADSFSPQGVRSVGPRLFDNLILLRPSRHAGSCVLGHAFSSAVGPPESLPSHGFVFSSRCRFSQFQNALA